MIELTDVTDEPHIFGEHRLLLDGVNFTLPAGRYALLSQTPEIHYALIDILAGLRSPTHGMVRHDALTSYPIGRMGFVRGKLNGYQMTKFVCSLYGIDPLGCLDFLMGVMTAPEFLPKRIFEWPVYVRQEYMFSLALVPEYQIYFVDHVIPVEESRFSRLWRAMFEEKLVGKTLILSNYREDQLLDYCTKGLIYEDGAFRIDDDLEQCLRRYTLRQSRSEQSSGAGDGIGDDDPELGEAGAETALF